MFFEGLDRKITLQRVTQVTDSVTGDVTYTIAEEIPIWAEFRALHGSERYEGLTERAKANASFIIRYRTDVTSQGWQIKDWLNRTWNIVGEPREATRKSGRRAVLDILCERMDSDKA
jgi:SPP1 family predicted phage head-tail adaptor